MKENNKQVNHKFRSRLYKGLGVGTISASTLGGVSVYEFLIKPSEQVGQEFESGIQMFMDNIIVQPETAQLNIVLALPFLIGIIVWLLVMKKKNKEYFKDKMSLSLFVLIAVLYLVYSIIGYAMSSLIGAWIGVMIEEFLFNPLAEKSMSEVEFQKDIEKEKRKEMARAIARKKAERDLGDV